MHCFPFVSNHFANNFRLLRFHQKQMKPLELLHNTFHYFDLYANSIYSAIIKLLSWLAYQCIIIPKAHLMYANQPRNSLKNKMCYIITKSSLTASQREHSWPVSGLDCSTTHTSPHTSPHTTMPNGQSKCALCHQ